MPLPLPVLVLRPCPTLTPFLCSFRAVSGVRPEGRGGECLGLSHVIFRLFSLHFPLLHKHRGGEGLCLWLSSVTKGSPCITGGTIHDPGGGSSLFAPPSNQSEKTVYVFDPPFIAAFDFDVQILERLSPSTEEVRPPTGVVVVVQTTSGVEGIAGWRRYTQQHTCLSRLRLPAVRRIESQPGGKAARAVLAPVLRIRPGLKSM